MTRIFSNGPSKDFVRNPFDRLIGTSNQVSLAAPYFTLAEPVVKAARSGKSVKLLVGLNAATSPKALSEVHEIPSLSVRYFTHRFHAKIYIFDDAAIIGSSNLTDGGMISNREAVINLDQPADLESVEEMKALFAELWESAQVLTTENLDTFRSAHTSAKRNAPNLDAMIENEVGRAEPSNINVSSRTQSSERIFLEALRRQVYEQFRPAFNEVIKLIEEKNLRRSELAEIGIANEANRFLNWVRLTHAVGDEAWQLAELRSEEERRVEIERLGNEWIHTNQNKVPDDYIDWLIAVKNTFSSVSSIELASKEEITKGLMSIHAFAEQFRFVKGGTKSLPTVFWLANEQDVDKVKKTLLHLVHGGGNFIQRLHDVLYDPSMKLKNFGRFCALELYGTIMPDECPPMNGRMAKALKYLGFDVPGV